MGLYDGSVDKVLVTSPNGPGLIPKTHLGIAEEGHQLPQVVDLHMCHGIWVPTHTHKINVKIEKKQIP